MKTILLISALCLLSGCAIVQKCDKPVDGYVTCTYLEAEVACVGSCAVPKK